MYREGKPLQDVIPPDRRRLHAALLVLGGMIAGATLYAGVRFFFSETHETQFGPIEPAVVATPPPSAFEAPSPPPVPMDQDVAARVVAAHRAAIRRTCWEGPTAERIDHAKVNLSLVVGEKGDVVSAQGTGDAPLVASCIEAQARGWQFPATGTRNTIEVPFVFTRQ